MPNAKVAEPGAAAEAWAASEPADDARLARMRALLEQSSPKKAPRASYQDPMVLSSGYAMPRVGLGTAHLFEAQIAANLAAGARHLDCARIYGNEAAVGRAVRASGVPRCELFLTTKLWMDEARPERVAAASCAKCAEKPVFCHWRVLSTVLAVRCVVHYRPAAVRH